MTIDTLRDFFSKKDNLISVATVVTSVGLLLVSIFTNAIGTNGLFQVILGILTLMAVAQLLERETRYAKTDYKIDALTHKLSLVGGPLFVHSTEIPSLEDLTAQSEELYLAGGNLNTLINKNLHFLENWLRRGKRLKVLVVNPDNQGLRHLYLPCMDYDPIQFEQYTTATLNRLRAFRRIPNANLEVRLSHFAPTQAIALPDGHRGGSVMYVGLYLPNGDAGTAPAFRLSRSEHPEWFQVFHERYYEFLWENSAEARLEADGKPNNPAAG
jgi:hypothetical protein